MISQENAILASLPLAEEIDSASFLKYEAVLKQGKRSGGPHALYAQSWNKIEYGFSLGDVAPVDEGLADMGAVANSLKVAEDYQPSFARAISTLAFKQAIRHRVLHPGPMDQEIIEQTLCAS